MIEVYDLKEVLKELIKASKPKVKAAGIEIAEITEITTAEQALETVKNDGWMLQYVPKKYQTYELCLEAVKQCGNALKFVPEEFKTPELCIEAVNQDNSGVAIEYVPEKRYVQDAIYVIIETAKSNGWKFDADTYLKTVKQDGRALCYVPEEHKTYELCLEAIKENHYAIEFVPEGHKTYELWLEMVKQDGMELQFVPKELRTTDMCFAAVKNNINAFMDVPENIKSQVKELLDAYENRMG